MAKATANCKCKECGTEFVRIKDCYNRKDADSWEAWAEENIDLCPICYAKATREAWEKKLAAYNLPEIIGVSEKQIKFATDLRIKTLKNADTMIKRIKSMMAMTEKITETAKKKNMTEEELIVTTMKQGECFDIYVALYETSARVLIDTLK